MLEDHQTHHTPVLLEQVLASLAPQQGESYLDVTAGYGGHAQAILDRTLQPKSAVLVDRDQYAVNHLQQRFGGAGTTIIHDDFYAASQTLLQAGQQFDCILADLGVSSPHLDNASRGFGFSQSGPLDMRMDQTQQLDAAGLINTIDEEGLIRILREYGEEPKARAIAKAILADRPFTTTEALAKTIERATFRGKYKRTHPATRSFQAIRIAVNDELGLLDKALPLWVDLLKPGGRLAVISFHSLEDRTVKRYFAHIAGDRYDAELRHLTKHPLTASPDELASNPRARSAKLRAVVKIKNKKG